MGQGEGEEMGCVGPTGPGSPSCCLRLSFYCQDIHFMGDPSMGFGRITTENVQTCGNRACLRVSGKAQGRTLATRPQTPPLPLYV